MSCSLLHFSYIAVPSVERRFRTTKRNIKIFRYCFWPIVLLILAFNVGGLFTGLFLFSLLPLCASYGINAVLSISEDKANDTYNKDYKLLNHDLRNLN